MPGEVALSAAETAHFGTLWKEVDTTGRGYVFGNEIKSLFTRSQLPQPVRAHSQQPPLS
jgi:hypothetical protein